MADLVRHAVGVDLVELAFRFALGEEVPDELALPRFSQPLAIRFLTSSPGPLPTGRVTRIGSLEPVLTAEGVVQAETYLVEGETIRPVRLDGDRRGYVIATADTSIEALERAAAPPGLLVVVVQFRARSTSTTTANCSTRPARAATASPTSTIRRRPETCSSATTSTSRSTPRCSWPSWR
jgi:hypothetical protein